jgi:uncharacterized LabA/DUF88 family protein
MKKAIVYIDGYNLYHGLKEAYGNKYKWLDLQSLAQDFTDNDTEVVAVKYFTAITKNKINTKLRQEVYLTALKSHCNKVEIILGKFLAKEKQCRECGEKYTTYEEKKTDVNIACQILNDAHLDKYDCCFIVSGDSDLVPPVKIIRESFSDKKVIIACPPKRKSSELCKSANNFFSISKQTIAINQLPRVIKRKEKSDLSRPITWL